MRWHHILYDITCIVSWHPSHYIWHYIESICVSKTSVSVIPHQLSVWHHTHSMYDNTLRMHDITWTHYDVTPVYVRHHPQYIYDILTIYMLSALLLSWKHNYTWHNTHYIWHHSHCISAATPTVSINHNNFGSYPTWHTFYIMHTLDGITITLYDIIPQYLWHHRHCIHDMRSPTYGITSSVYGISSPIPVTSHTLSFWIQINYI